MGNEIQLPMRTHVGGSGAVKLICTSGTGYSWVLTSMPACVGLMDVSAAPVGLPLPGAMLVETFTFIGLKTGDGMLEFHLIRPWQPNAPMDVRKVKVFVEPAIQLSADLEESIGKGQFLPPLTHTTVMDPMPAYGYPVPTTDAQVRPLYAYPMDGTQYPPLLKYGYPPLLKYGYPVPTEVNLEKVANPGTPTMMQSHQQCTVKYGTPWGEASQIGHCTMLYAVPLGDKDKQAS